MRGDDGMSGVAVVVLAAGRGTRFGGGKLLATLDGRPILQHVLDTVHAAGVERCVVVLGADAARLEIVIDWRGAERVINEGHEAGIASSLRLGVAASLRTRPDPLGVLVVLGDQPRTAADVMRALVAAAGDAREAGAWAVAPRYAGGGGGNPVLLLSEGIAQVPHLDGDRGMGALLAGDPGRVWRVDVPGSNPDVDTPADLAALTAETGGI